MIAHPSTQSSDKIHPINPLSSSQQPTTPITEQAALIATFYYQRDLTRPQTSQEAAKKLVAHLDDTFKFEADEKEADILYNSETGTIRHYFESVHPVAHDTTIVQLELKAKDKNQPAAIAWFHDLQELAVMDSHQGRVWLLDIPLEGDKVEAATVHIALYPQEVKDSFELNLLWGAHTKLFIPDLIAHKSYHQIREYRRYDQKIGYSQKLEALRHATADFLADSTHQTLTQELSNLRHDTHLLTSGVTLLELLHISLAKQLFNYRPYAKKAQEGDVFSFHHGHIETAVKELKLKVQEGRTVLDAAETAHHLIQQRAEKAQTTRQQLEERRHQLLGAILALLGTVLAVPQLIDREAADALQAWGRGIATDMQLRLLALIIIQSFFTLMVCILVFGFVLLAYNLLREDKT